MTLKNILFTTSLLACSITTAFAADYRHANSHELMGGVQVNGMIYGVATSLDQFNTPGGHVYVQPEEYKLRTFHMPANGTYPMDATFAGIQGKISCSFDGSGIQGFTQRQVNHGIDCTWKSSPSSDAEVKDFHLFLIDNHLDEQNKVTALYRGYEVAAKQLTGNLVVGEVIDVPVSLALDVADYRAGSNHKVYIRGAEYIDQDTKEKQRVTFTSKLDINQDGKADYRIKLLGCSNEIRSAGGVDIFVSGGAPKAECEFAIGERIKGSGWEYSPLTHLVTLK